MELWGQCRDCDRWFYCPSRDDGDGDWHCPVCGAEPVAVENRELQDRAPPE